MKQIITLLTFILVSLSTVSYAQSSSEVKRIERKTQRDAEKARIQAQEERAYAMASQALHDGKFVLECRPAGFQKRTKCICFINHKFRNDG